MEGKLYIRSRMSRSQLIMPWFLMMLTLDSHTLVIFIPPLTRFISWLYRPQAYLYPLRQLYFLCFYMARFSQLGTLCNKRYDCLYRRDQKVSSSSETSIKYPSWKHGRLIYNGVNTMVSIHITIPPFLQLQLTLSSRSSNPSPYLQLGGRVY